MPQFSTFKGINCRDTAQRRSPGRQPVLLRYDIDRRTLFYWARLYCNQLGLDQRVAGPVEKGPLAQPCDLLDQGL